MAKETFTDEQIELELERLRGSEYVHLAQKEIRLKYKRRQLVYQLRWLEKRGKQLEAMGITFDDMEEQFKALEDIDSAENMEYSEE